MAMCRALLEEVMWRLYKLEREKLGIVIALAESRYAHLRRWRLRKLNEAANKVIHNYGVHRKEIEERIALEFLETLKGIIEEARPQQTSPGPS